VPLASEGRLLAGRYRVLGRLGSGGMAVVVLAEDERLGRKVAVKRLHAESPEDAARRFEREAKLGASLNHPNIVAVYDIVSDEEGVLIVMEYVEGPTLRKKLDAGEMPPAQAIEILCGIAAALDHAHEHGVVHRDVKPANVLISERDGTVKLTDLGIATAAERTKITGSGIVLGTAAYMAPERLDGQAGGPGVDVYATAALAFEMLSGRKAVTGNTPIEVARRVMEAPPPDLTEARPGAPARAAEVLKRGLAKDPDARPATAGELVRELSAAYAESARPAPRPARPAPKPAPAAPPPVHHRARRGWIAPALVAALIAAVVAVVLIAGSGGGSDHKAARRSPATQPAKKSHKQSRATQPTASAPAPAPTPTQPAPPTATGSPAAAVSDFYTRAAGHDFQGAWDLGTANLHSQFGSISTFQGTFATLQSISLAGVRVASQSGNTATVEFSSVAQHTDHVDRCTGQATLVSQATRWLVDHLDVTCAGDGTKPPKAKKPKKH
jgi:eukaryotic-like serine/threonine-protein kinase